MAVARSDTMPVTAWLKHLPIVLLGGLFLYVIGFKAAYTGLWFDEITTYYVSGLDDAGAIIDALLARADNHPPIDYLARHYSMAILGPSEFSFRLPSILAMLLASVCLYIFVLRRATVLPAIVAFAFPLATYALRYSYEARPYALLFASMCLALLSWQLVTEKPTLLRLAFFTLCLSLGPHVHYYGVLNYVPLAAGELWRWWEQRRVSWTIVGCVVASFAIDALLIPFALHASEFATHFWTRVGPGEMPFIYSALFVDAVPGLVAAAAGCAIAAYFFRNGSDHQPNPPAIPRHEVVAVLVLCLVPASTYVLNALVTHAYADKYLINTVVGVALLLAFLTVRMQARRIVYALMIALSIGTWAGFRLVYMGRYTPAKPYALPAPVMQFFESATQPVAIFGDHRFMEMYFYLPPHLQAKVHLLTDRKLAIDYTGEDTNEIVIRNLQSIVKLPMDNLCEFTKAHRRFLLYVALPTWVVQQLIKDGATLTMIDGTTQKVAIMQAVLPRPSGC